MPAGIGETLRQARLAAGIELEDAERTIRIRTRYLHALENEDWAALPGEAYVRGFLHTYADYLGLDGAGLVAEYDREAPPPEAEHPAEIPLEAPRGGGGGAVGRRLGWVLVVLAGGLLALFVALSITGGDSDENGGGKRHQDRGGRREAGGATTTTTRAPSEASVSLTPTGTVWVCLVDGSGRALVNGETLSPGDARGPFKARELLLTLGNGEIDIQLNGEPVQVPSSANPVGLELTPDGARTLAPDAGPTCG